MAGSYSIEPERAITGQTPLPTAVARKAVDWPHVWAYIGLSFGLSWLIDLVIYLNGGLAGQGTRLLLQCMMLMPAFSAMLLGLFFFKDSPIYYKTNYSVSRWFIYFYFFMTLAYLAVAILGPVEPAQSLAISAYLGLLNFIGLALLLALRWRGGPGAFAGAGMAGGNWRTWQLYGLGVILFCGLETLLNYVFKLGQPADPAALYPPGTMEGLPPIAVMATTFLNTIIIGPLLGLIITFGEEYG